MSTDPTTPQEHNKAVAKTLGLTIHKSNVLGLSCVEEFEPFEPWNDFAAAVCALERFCKERKCAAVLGYLGTQDQWTCRMGGEELNTIPVYETATEAICQLIVRAGT